MNEAETRAEYVDPKLKKSGWGETGDSKILREFRFTEGRILVGGVRNKPDVADYVLVYKNRKIAVIEAKKEESQATEGVAQAKDYSSKLNIPYAYATNGKEIYEISMRFGAEKYIDKFPTPEELWNRILCDSGSCISGKRFNQSKENKHPSLLLCACNSQ